MKHRCRFIMIMKPETLISSGDLTSTIKWFFVSMIYVFVVLNVQKFILS